MADLSIKPTTGSGNKLIIQDQTGGAVLTTADSGATIENATFPTIKLTPTATASAPAGVEGALYYDSDENSLMKHNGTSWRRVSQGAATVATTAPSSPAVGDLWFDSTSGVAAMKVWSGTQWDQMSNKFAATGGTESTYSSGGVNYKVHTFTSSGTFTAESSADIDVLVVAGGGGGNQRNSSGGAGGGGVLSITKGVSAQAYTIVIGAGGAGGIGWAGTIAQSGVNTTAFGLTAYGGGIGGSRAPAPPTSGGSGGGAGGKTSHSYHTGGASTQTDQGGTGYGNAGGSSSSGQDYEAAGGGGAGAVGGNPVSATRGGHGGAGIQINIDGNNYYWAGGGGGCGYNEANGNGGIGGGGGATNHSASPAQTNGTGGGSAINSGTAGHWSATDSDCYGGSGGANSGGGAGGSYYNAATGGTGGSGIVIVRYAV